MMCAHLGSSKSSLASRLCCAVESPGAAAAPGASPESPAPSLNADTPFNDLAANTPDSEFLLAGHNDNGNTLPPGGHHGPVTGLPASPTRSFDSYAADARFGPPSPATGQLPEEDDEENLLRFAAPDLEGLAGSEFGDSRGEGGSAQRGAGPAEGVHTGGFSKHEGARFRKVKRL